MVMQDTVSDRARSLRCHPLPDSIFHFGCPIQNAWNPPSTPRLSKETTMPKLNSLDDLLVHELQDIYHAEGQILKALPKMAKAATHPELQGAFEEHLEQTEGQVERLDQAFKLLGVPAKGRKCEGMAGLLEKGKKVMEEKAQPSANEAPPLSAAPKMGD